MQVVVLAAQKGGVGRSTLSCHIGVELERRGYNSLLIDTAPQGSLEKWWKRRKAAQPALMVATDGDGLEEALPLLEGDYDFAIVDTPREPGDIVKK